MTGHMLHSGRLFGAMAFGEPGVGSNHITPLFIRMPVPGSTTRLPMEESSVVVIATIIPSRSAAVRLLTRLWPGIKARVPAARVQVDVMERVVATVATAVAHPQVVMVQAALATVAVTVAATWKTVAHVCPTLRFTLSATR